MAVKQLLAKKRELSVNPRKLRMAGKLPATIYGNKFSSLSIEIDTKEFHHANVTQTDIVNVQCDNETYKVILRNKQVHPYLDHTLNLEFLKIDDSRPITLDIPINFTGTAPGVKLGGTLWTPVKTIKVKALPHDIPSTIEIDLTSLESLTAVLTVSQVNYGEGITPMTDGRVILAKIIPPKVKDK